MVHQHRHAVRRSQAVTATLITVGIVVVCLLAWLSRREGAAQVSLAEALAKTESAKAEAADDHQLASATALATSLKNREAIEIAVSEDTDLAARARNVGLVRLRKPGPGN